MLALSPIPPLNLLASMQARQDEDEGNAAARASLPPQRHITTRIMHQWPQHQQTAANPPSRRAQEVHQLHCPQSVPTLAEDSALRRDMPQRNDESEDALKKHRISFSPAGAVWGKMGQGKQLSFRRMIRPKDYFLILRTMILRNDSCFAAGGSCLFSKKGKTA